MLISYKWLRRAGMDMRRLSRCRSFVTTGGVADIAVAGRCKVSVALTTTTGGVVRLDHKAMVVDIDDVRFDIAVGKRFLSEAVLDGGANCVKWPNGKMTKFDGPDV